VKTVPKPSYANVVARKYETLPPARRKLFLAALIWSAKPANAMGGVAVAQFGREPPRRASGV